MQLGDFLPLVRDTLRAPQDSLRRLMALNLDRRVLWQGLALVTVVSVILAEISIRIAIRRGGTMMMPFVADPFTTALVQFSFLVLMVFAVYWGGQMRGGRARFPDALLAIIWLQFMMVCLQVLQTAALLVVPVLAGGLGLFGLAMFLYLLTHFIATIHGFQSLPKVFLSIIIGFFVASFGLTMILAIIGVALPGPN